jgi:hypothetical protein
MTTTTVRPYYTGDAMLWRLAIAGHILPASGRHYIPVNARGEADPMIELMEIEVDPVGDNVARVLWQRVHDVMEKAPYIGKADLVKEMPRRPTAIMCSVKSIHELTSPIHDELVSARLCDIPLIASSEMYGQPPYVLTEDYWYMIEHMDTTDSTFIGAFYCADPAAQYRLKRG